MLTLNHQISWHIWKLLGLVARSDAYPPGIQMVMGSILPSGKTFVHGIGHEILSMPILSLLLVEAGQLSVTGKRMCTKYWLTVYV